MQNKEIEKDNTFKMSIPLITNAELNTIDNNLYDFVNQITKQVIHDKVLLVAQHIIKKQKEYIDQLENKVKELEKENMKIQVEIAKQVYFRSMPIEQMKQLQVKANKYDSLAERIEEDKNNLEFSRVLDADKGFGEDEEDMAVRKYIETLQELLEEK